MFIELFIKHSQIFTVNKSLKSRLSSRFCRETILWYITRQVNIWKLASPQDKTVLHEGPLQIQVTDDTLHPPSHNIIKNQESRRQRS